MKNIFVSYRRDDTAELVQPLVRNLKRLLAYDRLFLDVTIRPGSNFVDALDKALEKCDAALVIIGPRWLGVGDKGRRRIDDTSDFVRIEIERLLAREVPVVPVLVHGAQMPAAAELPQTIAALAQRQAILVDSGPEDFPQPVLDALLPIVRKWRPVTVHDEAGKTNWSHSWRDIAWLTDKDGWLCGAISEGGAGGHVGYGILLTTNDGGASWKQATNILSGRGQFNWGGYPYTWTEVGPISSIVLYPRERTEGREVVNGYIATTTGVYRATAPRPNFTEAVEWRRSTPEPGGRVPFTHFSFLVGIEGDNELYAVGWPGIANWVRDGSWTLQMQTFTHPIGMVAVAGGSDNRSVWAVGRAGKDDFGNWGSESHGALYHLEWPSNGWNRVPLPEIKFEETQNLLGLKVVDRSNLLVVGEKGLFIKGVRGRKGTWVWRRIPIPSQSSLRSVLVNEFGLWVIGSNGLILNSVDDGVHWTELNVPDVESDLIGIRYSGTTGWIVGQNIVLTCP